MSVDVPSTVRLAIGEIRRVSATPALQWAYLADDGVPGSLAGEPDQVLDRVRRLLLEAGELVTLPARLTVRVGTAGFQDDGRLGLAVTVSTDNRRQVGRWQGAFRFCRPAAAPDWGAPRPGLRVWLVDDEPVARTVLAALLAQLGVQSRSFEESAGVLAALDGGEPPPDLLLLDLSMPAPEGPELARLLRQRDFAAPVVGVSANRVHQDRADCIAAGMNDAIGKPVRPETLARTLWVWG